MKKKGTSKKRTKKRKIIIGGVAVIVIAAGAVIGVHALQGKKQSSAGVVKQSTMALQKMDLTNSISATGTIESKKSQDVSAGVTDVTVENVSVSVGDSVSKGDTILTFDADTLQDNLSDAQSSLSDAQTSGNQEIASAQTQYEEALSNQSYDNAKAAKSLAKAIRQRASAKKALQKAKAAAKSAGSKKQGDAASAQETLTKAQEAYEQAKTAVETARENKTSTARQDKSSVTQAKTSLDNARTNAEKSVKEAQKQVDSAQEALDKCEVTAPISGVITTLSVAEGDSYSGGTIAQIEDTSGYTITTSVDEYDISNVKKGQRVVILTDATDEDELEGKITFVAPSTESSSSTSGNGNAGTAGTTTSSSGYEVKIKITTKDSRLKLGMTAKCSIVLEEASDVYAVPYDAISQNANGEYYITVIDGQTAQQPAASANADGQDAQPQDASENGVAAPESTDGANGQMPGGGDRSAQKSDGDNTDSSTQQTRQITVTKGLETDYYTEISGDGLQEGLMVVIPTDEVSGDSSGSTEQNTNGFGGDMGGGNMGGGGGIPGGGNMGGGNMGGGPGGGN